MIFLLTFILMVAYTLVGLTFYFYFVGVVAGAGAVRSDGKPITNTTIVYAAGMWPIVYVALVVLAIERLVQHGK